MKKSSVQVFEALAHPARLKLVALLGRKERRVDQLVKLLRINASSVSHHLVVLRDAKLLITERRGKPAYHTLDKAVLRAALADLERSARLEVDV